MEKEEIVLSDFRRILIGNAPSEFLLEVFFRTLFTYLVFLILVKFLGKRMSGQLTLTEMALMISLGAIIGSPMQIPDRGIVTALIILIAALIFQRTVNSLSFQREWIEAFTQGKVSVVVKEGVIQLDQMRKERLSQAQLFAALRDKKIIHLGQVKRVYLESNGVFSIYRSSAALPGLCTLPKEDHDMPFIADNGINQAGYACTRCGTVSSTNDAPCSNCGDNHWTYAMN